MLVWSGFWNAINVGMLAYRRDLNVHFWHRRIQSGRYCTNAFAKLIFALLRGKNHSPVNVVDVAKMCVLMEVRLCDNSTHLLVTRKVYPIRQMPLLYRIPNRKIVTNCVGKQYLKFRDIVLTN